MISGVQISILKQNIFRLVDLGRDIVGPPVIRVEILHESVMSGTNVIGAGIRP